MSDLKKLKQAILTQKLLPLYYHDDSNVSIEILNALYAAGIRVVEYTSRGENAFSNFKIMRKHAKKSMPDLLLGIGTVKDGSAARKYVRAGADFIVSPIVSEKVAAAVKSKVLWIPGCMTPTEIALAESLGATLVKLFPGNVLGPGFIGAIRELFPGVDFMPTGGVEAEENNLREWFKAGAVAVGMGSKLISKKAIETGDYKSITTITGSVLQMIRTIHA
jgi:2-dehydro-3-deoxyphosphogluconate aldolase / (4S)-4-hydroxy-2-oxoglutarate aldolase